MIVNFIVEEKLIGFFQITIDKFLLFFVLK